MFTSMPFSPSLQAELGRPRRTRRLASSPRSRVWRAEVGGLPVVVKQLVGDGAPDRFRRELAALQLAGRANQPVVPELLATDADALVLVLERVGGASPGPDWPVSWARSLARLHASGLDADPAALPAWVGPSNSDVEAFLALAGQLGVAVAERVDCELRQLVERLGAAGASLLHGDPCPDNALLGTAGTRFIDLEQAAFGNGIVELAYLRIGFPTCWCVTACDGAVLRQAEQQYRDEWSRLTGTEPAGNLTDACIGWLIRGDALVERAHRGSTNQLERLVRADWNWGTVTARERLAYRLDVVAGLLVDQPEYPATGALTAALGTAVRTRWPGLGQPPVRHGR